MSSTCLDDSTKGYNAECIPLITHVYLSTTFPSILSKYFEDNQSLDECIVLGKWEVLKEPTKSGGKGKSGEEDLLGVSFGVATRRQRVKDPAPGPSSFSTGAYQQEGGYPRNSVLVIVVLGVTSSLEGNGEDVQVVGSMVRRKGGEDVGGEAPKRSSSQGVGDDCPVTLCFQSGGDDDKSLSIEGAYWRNQYYSSKNRQVIQFYYDPVEFQQWKVPQHYPILGLPQTFLHGLSYIQTAEYLTIPAQFTPAFPPVPLDHQDLGACSVLPTDSILTNNSVIRFISSRSSGLQQIIHKTAILLRALFPRAYPLLPVLNFLFLLLLDSVIGYLVTRYLLQFPNMMGLLHNAVDQMLLHLNHLLAWLRGAPAGLKLNPNLNSLYWRFFSYHIHLWANYIGILEPIFAVILHTIQYFGVLGVTIQISLLKDLLSLATFHVYCLYIYASRLYSLQTAAIKALCRVFFGRKYNPLRKRIDSVQLTTPELFLSSFGFVILIFLLPTTMVYYTGFVFLRVPVLIIERLLHYLVITYNKLPLISWLLVYLRSPRVADEIYLISLKTPSPNRVAFRISLQSTRTLFSPPNLGGGIKSIVSSVIDGTVLKD